MILLLPLDRRPTICQQRCQAIQCRRPVPRGGVCGRRRRRALWLHGLGWIRAGRRRQGRRGAAREAGGEIPAMSASMARAGGEGAEAGARRRRVGKRRRQRGYFHLRSRFHYLRSRFSLPSRPMVIPHDPLLTQNQSNTITSFSGPYT